MYIGTYIIHKCIYTATGCLIWVHRLHIHSEQERYIAIQFAKTDLMDEGHISTLDIYTYIKHIHTYTYVY